MLQSWEHLVAEVAYYTTRLCRGAFQVESLQKTTVLPLCHSDPRIRSMHLGLQTPLDVFSMPQIQRAARATANKHMVCGSKKKMFLRKNKTKHHRGRQVQWLEESNAGQGYDSLGLVWVSDVQHLGPLPQI